MVKRLSKVFMLAASGILISLAILALKGRSPFALSNAAKTEASPFQWRSGTYELQLFVSNQFDLAAVLAIARSQLATPQLSQSTMGIQGRLALKSKDKDQFALWFEDASFDSITYDGQVTGDLQSIAAEMRLPIEILSAPNGSFAAVDYQRSCKEICQRAWSSILASMQITEADSASPSEWQNTEHIMDASLVFSYKQDARKLRKTLAFINEFVPLKQIAGRLHSMVHGEYVYSQDQQGIKGMKGGIEFGFTHQGAVVYSRKESISMRLTGALPSVIPASSQAERIPWVPGALDKRSEKLAMEDAWRREVGEASLENLKAALREDLNREEEIVLYKKIRGFLYFNPQRSHEFLAELLAAEYNGNYNTLVAVALGRVGHEQAQAVLMEAIQERTKEGKEALNFIPLLAQTEKPTLATVAFLEKLSFENGPYKNTALLAYGQVLGPFASEQALLAKEKLNELLQRAESSPSSERDVYFDAIGNSAQAQTFVRLKLLLQKETNPETRASGITALRRMVDPEATAYLKVNIDHPQPKVQVASWASLGEHPYDQDLEAAAKLRLRSHSNENVQLAAMSWIWEHRLAVSAALDIFETVRNNAQLPTHVRQQAQSYADLLASPP